LTNFCRSCVVTDKQNLCVRVDLLPASNSIPLNDADVTGKGLGSRKKCEHRRIPDYIA